MRPRTSQLASPSLPSYGRTAGHGLGAGHVQPGRGYSHLEQLEIAWTLLRHHGPRDGVRRVHDGTRRQCALHGVPDKYDAHLTERWLAAIGEAIADQPDEDDFGRFVARHPALARGDLLAPPSA